MRLRLTQLERSKIQDNLELLERIATADVIVTLNRNDGERVCLWKRSVGEVEKRGIPMHPVVLTFEILSKAEQREYQEIIDQLKRAEPGVSA